MADLTARALYDTVRVPLSGPADYAINDGSFAIQDQSYLNCFPVSVSGPDGSKDVYINKRPGSERLGISLASILGNIDWALHANISITSLNDIYIAAIFDVTNSKFVICQYRPVTGTTLKVGEITGANFQDQLFLTELTIANTATLGIVYNSVDGVTSRGYYSTSVAGSFSGGITEITDTDFPPKRGSPLPLVGGMVQMNGQTYVLTNTGELCNSEVNSITSWRTEGVVQAISYPDQGVGLVRYKHHVVVFGEDSIEFFSDAGNPFPRSPLGRTDQAFIKFGAMSARTIMALDDTIYWLAKSASGTIGLWKLDGYSPVKLSSPGEDVLLSNAPSVAAGVTPQFCTISYYGQRHLLISGITLRPLGAATFFPNDPHALGPIELFSTLAYNINEKVFWGFAPGGDPEGSTNFTRFAPMGTSRYVLTNTYPETQYYLWNSVGSGFISYLVDPGYIYVNNPSGNIFVDGYEEGVDDGNTYTFYYSPNRIMFGNEKRKRIHKIKAVFDQLTSDFNPPETGAYLWFMIGRDEFTYQTADTQNVIMRYVEVPNDYNRYYVTNLGAFRTLYIALISKNAMGMRLRALEIDMSQGTS